MVCLWGQDKEFNLPSPRPKGGRVVAESELKKAHDRMKRLERLLGQKTDEVECLKEAIRIGREKKLISRQPLRRVEDFE
jgi:transposase